MKFYFAGIISVRSTHLWEKGRIQKHVDPADPDGSPTLVPGPDSSGYGIVTCYLLLTNIYRTKLDTVSYSWTNTFAKYVQYKMHQNTRIYWTLVPNQIYPWCTPVQKVRIYLVTLIFSFGKIENFVYLVLWRWHKKLTIQIRLSWDADPYVSWHGSIFLCWSGSDSAMESLHLDPALKLCHVNNQQILSPHNSKTFNHFKLFSKVRSRFLDPTK